MSSALPAQKVETGSGYPRGASLEQRGISSLPYLQLTVLGFFYFICPGLFDVLDSFPLIVETTPLSTLATSSLANVITFSVVAFFAGAVINLLGPRLSLFIGGLGYTLNIVSVWAVSNNHTVFKFIIAADAIQGACAGILSAAQGAVMLAYPTENQKGLVIGIFWSIFYLGPLIGAAITFSAQNSHSAEPFSSGKVLFPCFFVLTLVGASLALLMASPAKVIRADGTRVLVPRGSPWKVALYSIYAALKTDPLVLLLFPMFFTSGYFVYWQQINYNGIIFTARATTLNSLLFDVAQMVASLFLGFSILDRPNLSRRTRAFTAATIVFVLVFVVHMWTYFFRNSVSFPTIRLDSTDLTSPGYTARA